MTQSDPVGFCGTVTDSRASGITSTFSTSSLTAGWVNASLQNVALSSRDAGYSFNTNSIANTTGTTLPSFETNIWDVKNYLSSGSNSNFVYAPAGGSYKTTLATLKVKYVTTATAPVTNFSATQMIGLAPLSVTFNDTSTNTPTSWNWEYRASGTSDSWTSFATSQNVTNSFAAGAYDIRLTATNSGGSNMTAKTQYLSSSAGAKRLTTVKSGTVSGDLYVGAFQPVAWSSQSTTPGVRTFTQAYTIPTHTDVQWARLYAVVYAAGTDNRTGQAIVTFDSNGDGTYETTLGTEQLATGSTSAAEVYPVNDHVNRQYSDYMLWYNVTSYISNNTVNAQIVTQNVSGSNFDGRLKELTLVVAYNDGDTDSVQYWVNDGHDYQASGASGITSTFSTSSLTAGWVNASLQNVALSSRDAGYSFNINSIANTTGTTLPSFETNIWDVKNYLSSGSNSNFVYAPAGGSYKTTLATLKVKYVTTTTEQPDLNVTAISPNVGAGAFLFANEPNVISVTVKNNGPGSAGASTLSVDVAGTAYTASVGTLASGASQTVTVTDTVSRASGANVTINATADSGGVVSESDETNNVLISAQTVYNNGNKGKRFTGGSDINTTASFDGQYGVIYSAGNSAYTGGGWSAKTYSWTSTDLPIPAGATVTSARLYQGYTWDQTPGGNPLWTMMFNGATVTPTATYHDTKGYGTYDYPNGLYVYNVTSQFLTAGNSMTITPQTGNNNGIYGAYLIVVYQDPATTVKKIWINDECDILYAGTARSVTSDEATTYANFANVNTSGVASAQAIAILASANEAGKSKFFMNSNDYTGFWANYQATPQIGFSSYDVTSALQNGTNIAKIQSYDSGPGGDNMYVQNTILILKFGPVAAFTQSAVSGDTPFTVNFTDQSSGSPTSWAWNFGDGSTSTERNPVHTYSTAGTYTVQLSAANSGSSDHVTKTNLITVNERKVVQNTFNNTAIQTISTRHVQTLTINTTQQANVTTSGNVVTINGTSGWSSMAITMNDIPVTNATSVNGTVAFVKAVTESVTVPIANESTSAVQIVLNLTEMPGSTTAITQTITKDPDATAQSSFSLAATSAGKQIDDIAYTLNIAKTNLANAGEGGIIQSATLTMTVSPAWVITHGGTDHVVILRRADDGTTQILTPQLTGTDASGNYIFTVISPNGLSTFSLAAVSTVSGGVSSGGSTGGSSSSSFGSISSTIKESMIFDYVIPPAVSYSWVEITPVSKNGTLSITPLTADIATMPEIKATWKADIPKKPEGGGKITTSIVQKLPDSTLAAYQQALAGKGLAIRNISYSMVVTEDNIPQTLNATIEMTIPQDWVSSNGGIDQIKILRLDDSGSIELLDTAFCRYDRDSRYISFQAKSPNGLCTFTLVAVVTGPGLPQTTPTNSVTEVPHSSGSASSFISQVSTTVNDQYILWIIAGVIFTGGVALIIHMRLRNRKDT